MHVRWAALVGLVVGLVLAGGPVAQGQTRAAQRPPAIADLKFDPESPQTGDKLKVRFSLPEGTERAEVVWKVNGEEVQSSDYDLVEKLVELDRQVKGGDLVRAEITLFDSSGASLRTVSREVQVRNAAPVVRLSGQRMEGRTYRATVEAKDPEEGAIVLTLEDAPKGMRMDPKGNIDWPIGQGVSGSFQVKVKAMNEQGQITYLTFPVTIRWQ